MTFSIRMLTGALLLGALLAGATAPEALAQGWEKVKKDPPPPAPIIGTDAPEWSHDGRAPKMLNIQVGYPLVLSPRYFFPFKKKQQIGVGLILLPGLIGANGEYRYYVKSPQPNKLGFYGAGGATFYSIRSDDDTTSPLGLHLGAGTLYRTSGKFAYGGEVGFMAITGGKEESIKSFGLHKGKSGLYVNFQISYVF